MHASIAEGLATPGETRSAIAGRVPTLIVGAILVLGAIVLYLASNPARQNFYDHFVWQADAFLHGRAAILYPVPGNEYFQDVYPISTTEALLPFPPLPAVVLLPVVAVYGLETDQELVAALLAGIGIGLAFWLLGQLPIRLGVRTLTTVFLAAGSVYWWTATVGTTWYFAHIVAVDLTLVAVGVALRADRRAVRGLQGSTAPAADGRGHDPAVSPFDAGEPGAAGPAGVVWRSIAAAVPVDGRQVLAGFLFGLAATARLPVIVGAPFFVLVGGGGTWQRRGLSAALGAAIPVTALLAYNLATTGAFVHPAYEWQYQREQGYTALGYHPDWAIEDVRYIPQNLGIMFGSLPDVLPSARTHALGPDFQPDEPVCVTPGATRGLFDIDCPLALPRDIGTSLLVVSPAYLLALLGLRRFGRHRLMAGAALAVLAIALVDLAHFSQGWVQWGYRFSNDFVPFALPLIALGAAAADGTIRRGALVLVGLSVAINAWAWPGGTSWGGEASPGRRAGRSSTVRASCRTRVVRRRVRGVATRCRRGVMVGLLHDAMVRTA